MQFLGWHHFVFPPSNIVCGHKYDFIMLSDTMRWRQEYCIILRERRKIEIGELEGLRERKLKELYEVAHAIFQ